MAAGCDLSRSELAKARERGQYGVIARAAVGGSIPFRNDAFRTVMSNSSLEHLKDVDVTLKEIARVLRPAGRLYATFGSDFAYKWWPCGRKALDRYLSYQPVYNYFTLGEWQERLGDAGLRVVDHRYYLSSTSTRVLMFLDYHFSHVYMTNDKTLARPTIRLMRKIPAGFWARLWTILFSRVGIAVGGEGGGILIVAERTTTGDIDASVLAHENAGSPTS